MQPKRDPNDRRYWPVRLGGTSGFSDYHKRGMPSPYRYGAASKQGRLGEHPRHPELPNTVAETARTVDAEAVRARARLLAIRAMDQLEDSTSSMDVSQLVDTLNATGKLSGAITAQSAGGVTVNLGSLHLDALRAMRPSYIEGANVPSRITGQATVDAKLIDDNGLAEVTEGLPISPEPDGVDSRGGG